MLQTTLPSVRPKSSIPHAGHIRTIGKGGMGKVFLVEAGPEKFVIKELSPNNDPTSLTFGIDQIVQAETLPMLANPHGSHKNLVHVAGVMDVVEMRDYLCAAKISSGPINFAHPDTKYVLLEYMQGTDMVEVLMRSRQVTPFETAILLFQISSALEKIHEFGIIHRDVKPSNIYRVETDNETVFKLFDFGVATRMGTDLMLMPGMCLGTHQYIAPDQAKGNNTTAADIYSLGVSAIELLTGYLPFNGENVPDMLYAKLSQSPLDQRAKDLWPMHPIGIALHPIIQSCVELDPANRPTATQLKESILNIIRTATW